MKGGWVDRREPPAFDAEFAGGSQSLDPSHSFLVIQVLWNPPETCEMDH